VTDNCRSRNGISMPASLTKFHSMNYKLNLILLTFIALIVVTSCDKRDAIRNGTVEIEISGVEKKGTVPADGNLSVDVFFKSDEALEDLRVKLFKVGENRATLEGLEAIPSESDTNIIDFQKASSDKEFTFTETVDLSTYAAGTCFVIRASAVGTTEFSSGGIESNSFYFCED